MDSVVADLIARKSYPKALDPEEGAKAFVKNARGESVKVHELAEGSFFGEISILTGRPRTATLTAAAPCEVLELDKATLDTITQTHPHVLEVLKRFQKARAQDTVEAIIRNRP